MVKGDLTVLLGSFGTIVSRIYTEWSKRSRRGPHKETLLAAKSRKLSCFTGFSKVDDRKIRNMLTDMMSLGVNSMEAEIHPE